MATPLTHISEAEAARDLAITRSAASRHRTISDCIALAKAHETDTGISPVLDSDFANDIETIIRDRKPWNPSFWD